MAWTRVYAIDARANLPDTNARDRGDFDHQWLELVDAPTHARVEKC